MTRRDRWTVASLLVAAVLLFTIAFDLDQIEKSR